MQAEELLRRAAAVIEAGGWSVGALARDGTGRPVPLWAGDERAKVNPAAVSFSTYGAICKALDEGRGCSNLPMVWSVLDRLAAERTDAAAGGKNSLHGLYRFDEAEGRTQADVLALLEAAAAECAEPAQAVA